MLAPTSKSGRSRATPSATTATTSPWCATDEHGRNPSRIATILHSFHISGDGRSALGISDYELPNRSHAALAEVRYSDCALNTPALRDWPLSVVCLFDVDDLAEDDSHAMRQSHAVIRGEDINVDYYPGLSTNCSPNRSSRGLRTRRRSTSTGRSWATCAASSARSARPSAWRPTASTTSSWPPTRS